MGIDPTGLTEEEMLQEYANRVGEPVTDKGNWVESKDGETLINKDTGEEKAR